MLLSLLLHGKTRRLSNYRSPVMTRNIIPLCTDYSALERICENEEENFDKASAILQYLETHYATFEKVFESNFLPVDLVERRGFKKRLNKVNLKLLCFMYLKNGITEEIQSFVRFFLDYNLFLLIMGRKDFLLE